MKVTCDCNSNHGKQLKKQVVENSFILTKAFFQVFISKPSTDPLTKSFHFFPITSADLLVVVYLSEEHKLDETNNKAIWAVPEDLSETCKTSEPTLSIAIEIWPQSFQTLPSRDGSHLCPRFQNSHLVLSDYGCLSSCWLFLVYWLCLLLAQLQSILYTIYSLTTEQEASPYSHFEKRSETFQWQTRGQL